VLVLCGTPIGIALGVSATIVLASFDLGIQMTGANFVSAIASFPLLAIPFFVLAGVILQRAGLAAKIARLFELLVGRMPGGLAIVSVATCMFWGALSGSGPATTVAVGMILIRPMIKHGYDRNFAAATIANASDLSIIIPPSIAFIIYGNLTGANVSALFLAGVIPGILCGLGIAAVAWALSLINGYAGTGRRGSFRAIAKAGVEAFWALLAPVIILGGIYMAVFTPTEAAVVAVVYSLFIGMVIYRTVRWGDLIPMLVESAVTSSVIMFIVVFAGLFSWAASTTGVVDAAAQFLIARSPNAMVTVLLINLLLLALGMFLDAISISYLIMPILLPVIHAFGLDPVWYGVVFITALAIGQITPPVGVNLATVANLAETDMDSVSRKLLPYIAVNVLVLIILTLFSGLALYLPAKAGLLVK
jgi:C4-dicarboxylate transporter DctM subunit